MDFLSALYAASGLAVGLAYLPQIVNLRRDKTGAASTSITTWLQFSVCGVIGLLCALFRVGDPLMILTCGIVTLGNISVLTLALIRRYGLSLTDLPRAPQPGQTWPE